MSPFVINGGLGVEEILDLVEEVLHTDMNGALETVYNRRVEADQKRAELRNTAYEPIPYDTLDASHYHVGNFPSLVLEEVPPKAYPYVVLTIEDYAPDAEDARSDHVNVYRDSLVVHCLAKASDAEGSEVVFRRAVRMGEAVYLCLASNPGTKQLLAGISNPARGQHSIPWTYQHKGRGKDWWFQAVGTTYAIKTYTTEFD